MIQFTTKGFQYNRELLIIVPPAFKAAVAMLLEKSTAKHAGYLTVKLDLPHRLRTTGRRSQNNRFYGHCEDLAEQILDESGEPKYIKEQIHDAMLRMSVSEGYPTYLDLNGVETPLPSARASVEQMQIVTKTLQRFADIHALWLHEYVAEGPHKGKAYRSIGGRSYEEMRIYAAENGWILKEGEESND